MRKITVVCLGFAALWTIVVLIGAATVPVYSGSSTTVSSDGSSSTTTTSATLVHVNGAWVFLLLAVPAIAVLLTACLLAIERRHRWAVWAAWAPVALVGAVALLGMLTIGIFLLPVAALLWCAVLTATLDRTSSRSPDR